MFLNIVTKWREIQKSKLNNSLTNLALQKNVSHSILSCHAFLKLLFVLPYLEISFSCRKPLKSKNKKHRIFKNAKFYYPPKFKCKRTKNTKVVPWMHLFVSYVPTVNFLSLLLCSCTELNDQHIDGNSFFPCLSYDLKISEGDHVCRKKQEMLIRPSLPQKYTCSHSKAVF